MCPSQHPSTELLALSASIHGPSPQEAAIDAGLDALEAHKAYVDGIFAYLEREALRDRGEEDDDD
jgi:hypothetical protein